MDSRLAVLAAETLAEPVVFVEGQGDARLLFPPRRIDRVGDAAGTRVYIDGVDYTTHDSGRVHRPPASAMPLVPAQALAVDDAEAMYSRLVVVTYAPAVDVAPPAPAPPPAPLAHTRHRLRQGGPLSICLVGDSISEGYDASGFHGVPPMRPGYASLVVMGLEQSHGSAVRLHNLAVAGSSAADGRWMAPQVVETEPDLLVVAYGMNDANWADAPEYAANLAVLVQEVRAARPAVEVLLVSPMLAAPGCWWVSRDRFDQYRDALIVLAGQLDAGLADVTGVWTAALERKSAYDLTANGTNHPNDFGHWIYARVILGVLADC